MAAATSDQVSARRTAARSSFTRPGALRPTPSALLATDPATRLLAEGSLLTKPHTGATTAKIRREATMANVEQFERVVIEAGAVAMRIMRGPKGAERLVIQAPGGLITREVPLRGDLGKDIQAATTSAQEIVASAKSLTANPARYLSASAITAIQTENLMPSTSRLPRRP